MSYIKHLSKCPYYKKPLLPRKIPGCAPVCELLHFSFKCKKHVAKNIRF